MTIPGFWAGVIYSPRQTLARSVMRKTLLDLRAPCAKSLDQLLCVLIRHSPQDYLEVTLIDQPRNSPKDIAMGALSDLLQELGSSPFPSSPISIPANSERARLEPLGVAPALIAAPEPENCHSGAKPPRQRMLAAASMASRGRTKIQWSQRLPHLPSGHKWAGVGVVVLSDVTSFRG